MSELRRPGGPATLPRALLVVLLISTLARLALAGLLDLGQDEAYALAISRPFQWSFFDHPPMAFWIAGVMQAMFGRDIAPILLRLPFVLMFSGTLLALFAMTRRAYGERAGLWAAGLLTAAPFFFASAGSWVVPDGPLLLFLTLAGLFLMRALPADAGWRDWLLAGFFLGLALLSKYQAVLAAGGAVLVLLLPANRRWLARPQPYAAAAVALLLFTPVLVWNAENGWISFAFELGRGGHAHLDLASGLVLLAGEAVYLLPWTLIALIAVLFAGPQRGVFVALAVPPVLLFNVLPFLGAASLPHWSMSGWIFLFPPLGAVLARAVENGRRWPRVLGMASGLAMAIIAVAAVALLSNIRIYGGNAELNRYLVEATSWTGLRQGLAEKRLLDRPRTFLAAIGWLDAAHIAEALRPAQPPVVLGNDPRGFAFLDNPARHLGEDALLFATPDAAPAIRKFAEASFASVEEVGTATTSKGGLPAFAHTIFLAHDFRTSIPAPYGIKP